MAAPLALRTDFTGAVVRRQARRSRDANQACRLLALAVINEGGSRSDAAPVGGVGDRDGTSYHWARKTCGAVTPRAFGCRFS
jgi:hypothetical protein